MTVRQSTSGPVADLPLDSWLYEAKPKPGCARCAAEKAKLDQAVSAGDASARFEAARNIRLCQHGARG
jgi:phosphoglycolate phosphatase-like HAD superfamily hydrolase